MIDQGEQPCGKAPAAESAYLDVDAAAAGGGRKKAVCMKCGGAFQGYMYRSHLSFHPLPPLASQLLSSELHLRLQKKIH